MSRSRSLALIVAAALTAALAPAALASAAAPAKEDRVQAEHDRIVAYWTPERMKAAKPRDFVRQKDGSFTLAPTPKAKPGGSGSTTSSVTGASWPNGRGDVPVLTGRIYFTFGSSAYVCSGSVADDGDLTKAQSIILTAGHCVYDQAKAAFADNLIFIPNFDAAPTYTCENTAYGCWTATTLVAHQGFTRERSFSAAGAVYDFAFAIVGPGGKSDTALDLVLNNVTKRPSYGLIYSGVATGQVLSAFGYPAAGKYRGNDLTYCSGAIREDSANQGRTWGMACNMTGGSSGGPWLTTQSGTDADTKKLDLLTGVGGELASLNSYGYSGTSVMYGPKFTEETKRVYDAAILADPQTRSVVVPLSR
jgi:hypothetical protein